MTDTLIETSVQLTSNLTSKVISSDNIGILGFLAAILLLNINVSR